MDMKPLPYRGPLEDYVAQARELLRAWEAGDDTAVQIVRAHHPRFTDPEISWLPNRQQSDDEARRAKLDLADIQEAVARAYNFLDWASLVEYVGAVRTDGSPVHLFESAVEAVVNGDLDALQSLLGQYPHLIRARSTRVCCFDPPRHRATLLHYVAANGVENNRQKTPKNAVEIARALLQAGAEPDSVAYLYGGECTTMSLLVSSSHPAGAGLQVALVDLLADFGAAVEPHGSGNWNSPLMTALVFGYLDAAQALVRRGARVDNVSAAAGLGLVEETRRMLANASREDRHRALALAAQLGHADVVRLLLDVGEDPNRYNPPGGHTHSTPLHQAALAGHDAVVRLMVERGARLDIRDKIYNATPLGWALHAGHAQVADYLRAQGAPE